MSQKNNYDSFDVAFCPMVNVKVSVKDPLHPTQKEIDKIIRLAAQNLLENYDEEIIQENVDFIRPYDSKTGFTGDIIE